MDFFGNLSFSMVLVSASSSTGRSIVHYSKEGSPMKKFVLLGTLVLLGAYLNVVALPDESHAGSFTAFGPKDYVRTSGKPTTVKENFSILDPNTHYTLHLYNGGKNNQHYGKPSRWGRLAHGWRHFDRDKHSQEKVSSAIIRLNGRIIIGPSHFNQNVSHIQKSVRLLKNNKLAVEIRGKPEGRITIEITGIDKIPPTISATISPSPNAAGWNNTNVTVSFVCSDTTSGIASCSEAVEVQQEGANQVIMGTATDIAGNTASTSVTISIDKTPPVVTILSPLSGASLQDSPANVQGMVDDALSGVAEITCNGILANLSNSSFTCSVPLVSGQNILETAATDLAGNDGYSSITVAFVQLALELAYVDDFQLMWRDKGSGGDFDGAYYRPVVPTGFYSLGHYGQGDYGVPRGFVFAARELRDGALASPVDYTWVYSDWGSGADMDGSFWRPVPPSEDYVCLGLVAQTGYSKPSTDAVRCVRKDLTVPAKVGNTIWIDQGTGATYYFGSWQIIPADENGIFLGTFTGSGGTNDSSWSPPTDPLFTIDARIVKRYEIGSDDIAQLIQQYGPDLLLSGTGNMIPTSPEQYFLDTPEYVLDNGTVLVWGLVQNEWNYSSFSFTPLGNVTTSTATLLQDVASYVESSPYFGDPSFRQYLDIDDSVRQGSLDRAQAFVRVRPWNWLFTELQFWFFYPFNGPARAEVCTSGNWCDIQFFDQLGRHYGDWEYVTLRVDNRTKKLSSVYMSRHAGGQWITSGNNFEQILQFDGTHPQIYVALHSHAHYSTPGAHDYYRAWEKDYVVGTASVDLRDMTDGEGPVFSTYLPGKYRIISSALPGYQVTEPEWLQFQGRWGQYVRNSDDFYIPNTPFPVHTYTEVGSGPTGPAMKSSWTRGDSGKNWWWTRNLEGNEACFDGIDNDGDGEIDCHDPDCWQVDPVCIHRGWSLCHIAPDIFGPCPPPGY